MDLLQQSIGTVKQELNEIDWKSAVSPSNVKLAKHLSAFANYPGGGYMVFGINNEGEAVGISTTYANETMERLSSIGRDALSPLVRMSHAIQDFSGHSILIVYVHESDVKPVYLNGRSIEECYIRSGATSRVASRQEIGSLMLNSKTPVFEELHCSKLKSEQEILDLLDYRRVFKLLNKPVPQNNEEILQWLTDERMIEPVDGIGYYVTNFGALAAAHNLNSFETLSRKAIRVIKYDGVNKEKTEKEYQGSKGYAIAFSNLIGFIKALLPNSEILKNALRQDTSIYPEVALRELIANALIHQDFSIKGTGPMIEIFDDRIEISNPGKLLPSKRIDRLIRTTPESRNELFAAAFRRYNICEERGSGFEKSVSAIEFYGLPPLKFIETENAFRIIMYSPRKFAQMTADERLEAAYQHSIIKYFSSGGMTNTSLRERFRMHEKQRPQISLLIKEALTVGKIKPKDPNNESMKFSEYIPYWG